MSANPAKKKLSNDELKVEMTKLWSAGERGKCKFYTLLTTNGFQLDKARCLRMYDVVTKELAQNTIEAQDDALASSAKAAINRAILSDKKIEAILCTIISGNMKFEEMVGGKVAVRHASPGEITAAAREIFKKRGSYAPRKIAQTNSAGEDVEPPFTDKQVQEILEALQK